MKSKQALLVASLIAGLSSAPSRAYEVWMGTHLMQSTTASNLADWDLTASLLDGVNINRAPHDTFPASNSDWQTILGQFSHVQNTMTEIARSEVSKNPLTVDEAAYSAIAAELQQKFQGANNFNYEIDHLMIYDERGTYQGTEYLYSWTETEAQYMRDWLDTNGHQDVSMIWNARNNSQANRDWSESSLIDHVLIEASADALLNNANNQITLLNWLWTNPATASKDVILQIPRSNNLMTQYASTRRVAVMLGDEIGYETGLQSDRLVFLPVTYNDNYEYLPETTSNGTSYTNSLTSLALSLLEQRSLFEGRLGTPTNADADSFARKLPALSGALIAGWDTWTSSGVQAPNVTDGSTTGTTSKSGFGLDLDHRASTDGTWGNLDTPTADPTANDDNDAVRLVNGSSGYYDFTVTDTSGFARDLTGFHFDAATLRPDSARDFELSVITGHLTLGTVAMGRVPSFTGGVQDWSSFDIDLTRLDDRTLDANGTVTFRLEFTGGIPGAGGHHQGLDNVAISAEAPVLPSRLIAGWDTWDSGAAPTASATAAGVTGSAVTTSTGSSWHTTDGRGASADGDWGAFAGPPTASIVAGDGVQGENLELPNATTGGTITFTITNNSASDIVLDGFHFDAYAFRPKAARAYELSVASGDITNGVIYTSADDEITSVDGAWDNLAHDDISHSLSGLADNVLEAGGTVEFLLAFSSGAGDGSGGHDLWVDNVAVTGAIDSIPGDFDGDGDVDGGDFLEWQRNDGTPAGLAAWQSNYGAPAQLAASSAVVPEPGALMLFACGVFLQLTALPARHRQLQRRDDD